MSELDNGSISITLSGITVEDRYLTNKAESKQDSGEYGWIIELYGNPCDYSVSTQCWAFDPGREEYKSPVEMQSSIWRRGEDSWNWIGDASLSYTSSSMTWVFSMPETEDFDLSRIANITVRYSEDGVWYRGEILWK